jgi:hypothetical protein
VVVSNFSGVDIYINDGSGSLVKETSLQTTYPQITSIAIGDLNADGFGDLVLGEGGSFDDDEAEVFFGGAAGTFSAAVPLPQFVGNSYLQQQILVADLNEDGLPDLVGVSAPITELGSQLTVLLNQGNGGFQMTSYFALFRAFAVLPRSSKAPDILMLNGNVDDISSVQVLDNTCAGSFRLGRAYEIGVGYFGSGVPFTVGDFNGDCIPDIAISNASNCQPGVAAITILYGDGEGGFGLPQAVQPSGNGPNVLASLGPVETPRALVASNICLGGFTVYGDASR